ncbi:MAG: hypothetical protein AAF558_10270 [Verrucomicrobiota bacterium]
MGMLGDICLAQGDSRAIHWKYQIARSLVHSDDAWFDLARAGIELGQFAISQTALECVNNRQSSDYLSLQGVLAYLKGHVDLAVTSFSGSLAQEHNELNEFNYAAASALSNDPKIFKGAQNQLKEFLQREGFQLAAARSLILSYSQHGHLESALPLLSILQNSSLPADRSLALCLRLQSLDSIDSLDPEIRTPADRLLISAWLRDRGQLHQALEMLIPVMDGDHAGVALSVAELYLELEQPQKAIASLAGVHGILADLIRWKADRSDENLRAFKACIQPYRESPLYLYSAIRLLESWNCPAELEIVYLSLIETPHGANVYQKLLSYYLENDNALAAYQASRSRFQFSKSFISANNYTYLAQVLGLDTQETHKIIEDLFREKSRYLEVKANYYLSLKKRKQPLPGNLDPRKMEIVFKRNIQRFSEERRLIDTLFPKEI